ncbi:MAG: hypothetical protein ISS81_06835 [Candidatus Marinimicrobia bacterium]|nr:hypothetical protein [Candidatus Neomarinimicrobiota bacterium]
MTETEIKLDDTRIQLEMAMSKENITKIDVVRSCINAFISNARSVTFTMQKESGSSDKFAKWYKGRQEEMKSNPLLKFFNEQRVISIHQQSVRPNQRFVNITKVEQGGHLVGTGGTVMTYEFEGFSKIVRGDSGNVFRLCKQYYTYMQQLVNDWLKVMK